MYIAMCVYMLSVCVCCLFVCLCVCIFICVFVCVSMYLYVGVSKCPYVCKFVCLCACMSMSYVHTIVLFMHSQGLTFDFSAYPLPK